MFWVKILQCKNWSCDYNYTPMDILSAWLILNSEYILIKSFGTFLFWIQTRSNCKKLEPYRKDFLKVSTFLVQRLLNFFKEFDAMYIVYTRVIYDRVRNRKNYFEIPAFLQIERGISRAGNSKSNENKNVFVYVFIWCFEFSHSWFSSFNLKKGGNFKIIFPFPYPIIYNPDITLQCMRQIFLNMLIWQMLNNFLIVL